MKQLLFNKLSRKKKDEFLSNDLNERLIRVEQRVSARFGKIIPYPKTAYYNSLSQEQKKSFENYLKFRDKKKVIISFMFLIPILVFFFVNVNFTGNVINDSLESNHIFSYAINFIVLTGILVLIFSWIYRKSRNKKYENHFKVVENLGYRIKM